MMKLKPCLAPSQLQTAVGTVRYGWRITTTTTKQDKNKQTNKQTNKQQQQNLICPRSHSTPSNRSSYFIKHTHRRSKFTTRYQITRSFSSHNNYSKKKSDNGSHLELQAAAVLQTTTTTQSGQRSEQVFLEERLERLERRNKIMRNI